MKFPNIEKMGLKLIGYRRGTIEKFEKDEILVDAQDLERILENAQTVYGCKISTNWHWGDTQDATDVKHDTHSAKLLCVEKIKRGVTKAEIVAELRKKSCFREPVKILQDLADRIEREGIIND